MVDILTSTFQELFDFAAEKLLVQGCKSFELGTCRYRGPNGTKCAIGHMVSDEKYHPTFESNDAIFVMEVFAGNMNSPGGWGRSPLFSSSDHDSDYRKRGRFLNALQACHDNAKDDDFVTEFRDRMIDLAKKHDLNHSSVRKAA
jgi:hypothetical protein